MLGSGGLLTRARSFLRDEDGPTAVEYAVLLTMIIVVAAASIKAYGVALLGMYEEISNAIPSS